MMTNEEWHSWYEEHGSRFGQFIRVDDAVAIRDAAPLSLRSADMNRDAVAVGRYMRRWQDTGGDLADTVPCVPGDTFCDPAMEYSKIVGFLSATL